jgi:predicted PurR-regulated permease PerM
VDVNPTTPPGESADDSGRGAADSAAGGRRGETGGRRPPTVFPPWSSSFVRHAALWLIAAIVSGLFLERLADSLAHRLAGIFQLIVVSLFLSFAIEPAVGWLARRGWRRGLATGLIFLAVAVAVAAAGLLALLIPAVVTGTRELITSLPDLLNNLAKYLKPFGVKLDRAPKLTAKTMDVSAPIAFAAALIGGALGGFLFAFLSLPVAGPRGETGPGGDPGTSDQADDQT